MDKMKINKCIYSFGAVEDVEKVPGEIGPVEPVASVVPAVKVERSESGKDVITEPIESGKGITKEQVYRVEGILSQLTRRYEEIGEMVDGLYIELENARGMVKMYEGRMGALRIGGDREVIGGYISNIEGEKGNIEKTYSWGMEYFLVVEKAIAEFHDRMRLLYYKRVSYLNKMLSGEIGYSENIDIIDFKITEYDELGKYVYKDKLETGTIFSIFDRMIKKFMEWKNTIPWAENGMKILIKMVEEVPLGENIGEGEDAERVWKEYVLKCNSLKENCISSIKKAERKGKTESDFLIPIGTFRVESAGRFNDDIEHYFNMFRYKANSNIGITFDKRTDIFYRLLGFKDDYKAMYNFYINKLRDIYYHSQGFTNITKLRELSYNHNLGEEELNKILEQLNIKDEEVKAQENLFTDKINNFKATVLKDDSLFKGFDDKLELLCSGPEHINNDLEFDDLDKKILTWAGKEGKLKILTIYREHRGGFITKFKTFKELMKKGNKDLNYIKSIGEDEIDNRLDKTEKLFNIIQANNLGTEVVEEIKRPMTIDNCGIVSEKLYGIIDYLHNMSDVLSANHYADYNNTPAKQKYIFELLKNPIVMGNDEGFMKDYVLLKTRLESYSKISSDTFDLDGNQLNELVLDSSGENVSKLDYILGELSKKGLDIVKFKADVEKYQKLLESGEIIKLKNNMAAREEMRLLSNELFKVVKYEEYKDVLNEHSDKLGAKEKYNSVWEKMGQDLGEYRFRVLDADKEVSTYLQIGIYTKCCQWIGGVGKAAAVDSLVNPVANVVVLEHKGKGWELVSESYFHYVPGDNSIILDNIEWVSGKVRALGLDDDKLSVVYEEYAKHLVRQGFSKVLCGMGYNKVGNDYFAIEKMDKDPREFSMFVEDKYSVYTDFGIDKHLNMLKPKNALKSKSGRRLEMIIRLGGMN